VNPETGLHYFD